MSIIVRNVSRKGYGQPRAVKVPDTLDHDEVDALYDFCFEWFGDKMGTYRLNTIKDDDPDPDALDVMRQDDAPVVLFDRDEHGWVPVRGGMWIVEPKDDQGDGFICLTDEEFQQDWEVSGG